MKNRNNLVALREQWWCLAVLFRDACWRLDELEHPYTKEQRSDAIAIARLRRMRVAKNRKRRRVMKALAARKAAGR